MSNSYIYSRLYAWYDSNRRVLPWRETDDAYAIWLSEIILQQTRVAQGMEYYMRFVSRWPNVEALAAADESEVLREWQGLGYYSRARNLHKAAQMIVERQKSASLKEESPILFPRTFEELRALPGVGDYTAGAIASFAYNMPYPAMDGNVYRVVARLFDIDEAFDTTSGKKLFHKQIEALLDRENPRLFNSAIMEFGALQCTPVLGDNCSVCPLQSVCMAYAHGTADLLPVRKPRLQLRDRWLEYHVYVCREVTCETYTLLRRRENPKDIWYHLYEFPCEEVKEEELQVTGYGLREKETAAFACTHVLSHQRLHARFYVHKVKELPNLPGTFRVSWPALDDHALSSLTLRALASLGL